MAEKLNISREDLAKVRRRDIPKPSPSTVIAVVMLLVGAGIMAYPFASDWWNSYRQTRAIATYVEAVQNTDSEKIERMLAGARAYNARLVNDAGRWTLNDAEKAEYDSLLDLTGDGIMGFVQIRSLNVDYPIYHGMDDTVLQVAVGHLPGSSLPVGGSSTHAVVSGHRGLPSARLFSDLDKMREGDTFTITVLNQTVTYEVDQIRIVLPQNMADLKIESGKDYVTLVTCTPYSVNTHRLLVRGHRIPNIDGDEAIAAEALQIPRYIAIPAVGIPILFTFLVGMLIYYRVRRPAFDKDMMIGIIREKVYMRRNTDGTGDKR